MKSLNPTDPQWWSSRRMHQRNAVPSLMTLRDWMSWSCHGWKPSPPWGVMHPECPAEFFELRDQVILNLEKEDPTPRTALRICAEMAKASPEFHIWVQENFNAKLA